MTAASVLPAPARPPHDPLWKGLGGVTGWPAAITATAVEVDADSGALTLAIASGALRMLSEESGSLGGLVPPPHVAVDCDGFIWLLGRNSGVLHRFDRCTCTFVAVPCTAGRGKGARQLITPGGIAIDVATLFVCDAGPPGRLLVFDRGSFALRAIWAPPPHAIANPWTPRAVAVDGGTVFVADPANGAVHRFARWGNWLGRWSGLGAVTALALDCRRRLFAVVPGAAKVAALTPLGGAAGLYARPEEVALAFPCVPFPVSREGAIDLSAICPALQGKGFDYDGNVIDLPPPPDPYYAANGNWIAPPIDSRIAQCAWHAVRADAEIARSQTIRFATYTADVSLPDADIALLPASAWTDVPGAAPGEDALILSPPGRYLWIKITLQGDGVSRPRLCSATIEYPRISLRRYLPAAFGSDPQSSDFTDRLLAIFDRGFRDIEAGIDDRAVLFDADSAPAQANHDILGWIAAWLGLELERGLPEAKRRALLKSASKVFACRGTPQGLRHTLLLWLGWTPPPVIPRRAACAPRCDPPARCPDLPQIILEHYKLRRWLWLGKGRLGSDAVLWGETILRRSQLGSTAQAGATKLDVTRNPLTDPFNLASNRFSVYLPARHVASPVQRAQLDRIVAEHRAADALPIIFPVHPRMRIGVQASIGFDSVVGCWPSGITLDAAQLGRGTVVSGTNPSGVSTRIGRTARLQPARSPAAARKPECRA